MVTELLLIRAQLRPRLDLEAAGRFACWWGKVRRQWAV
jgi:hypothetical protein